MAIQSGTRSDTGGTYTSTTTKPTTTTTTNQYGGAGTNYGPTYTSPTVGGMDAVSQQIMGIAGATEWPYAPGYRPILRNGQLVLSNDPGLVNAYGIVVQPFGQQYYNLDTDPRYMYGSLGPSERQLLLKRLVESGFLDSDYVGDYASEIRALAEAMDFSNTVGLELTNALGQRIAGGGGRRPGGGGGAVRVYRTTNPQDLVALVKTVSQDRLGRELTDQEAAGFVQQYQQQELSFQRGAYAGGQVTEPPSPEIAAINYVTTAAPKEESAYRYLGYMNMLFDSVGSV